MRAIWKIARKSLIRWIRKVCLRTGDLSWKLHGRKCAIGRRGKIQTGLEVERSLVLEGSA